MGKVVGYKKENERLFCQGHGKKTRFFKKVLKNWEEEFNQETSQMEFTVTLNSGFSFLVDDHLSTNIFNSTEQAMASLHKIFKCACDSCMAKKMREKNNGYLLTKIYV